MSTASELAERAARMAAKAAERDTTAAAARLAEQGRHAQQVAAARGLDTRDRSDPAALREPGRVGPSPASDPEPAPDLPSPGAGSGVLRRRYRRYGDRATAVVPVTATAADLLAVLDPETVRVFMVGARPSSVRAWAAVTLPEGWEHSTAGHYLTGGSPVWKFTRGPRRVEVHLASALLGDGGTVDQAAQALALVDGQLRAWGLKLLASAATTGRAVIERTLPAGDWPTLPDELQELIRATSGQGRWQPSASGGPLVEPGTVLPGLHEYDGRFMYAALCWGLGRGPAVHDHGTEFLGQRRGRYLVEWSAPEGWAGPGLLGETVEGGGPRAWAYPLRGRAWVDGAELQVAIGQGWKVRISERLLLADLKPCPDPLGLWARRMVAAREGVADPDPMVVTMARRAWRAITVATIGSLHGRPHEVTRICSIEQARQAPATATVDGDWLVWGESTGRTAWPAMSHPEWSAAIWARARARLLSGPSQVGALHLRAGTQVVGFRTDAIYVTGRQPHWERNDDGRVGRMVYRGGVDHQVEAPATSSELLAIRNHWNGSN